ncbi:hypothetical protein CSAL01_05039 [Colletotrichum salicis]|uniref:Heterokaryon incompatibility domain-containing protein n=1 Tax=Colletotrichum salicis TaxID=1209931 RepID=A0A135S2U6_9PEZI|nr:hypothetical protein CSAL01_05039 [Colletotrichum salicis]
MICACCRFVLGTQQDYKLITGNRGWKDPEEPHHRDYKNLTASVDAGCYICNRLWAALYTVERQDIRQLSAEPTKRESTEETESPLTSGYLTNGAQFAYPYAFMLHVALDCNSLCIIQRGDEFADWRKESTDMNKIYSGPFVNISAADAPDANHSLFHGRNPDAFCPQTIDLPVDSKDTRFLVQDYGFWRTEVSNAVINTRAWVLQERLLSPRVLYFGQRQILWECQQKEDAEIYPEGLLIDLSRFPSRIKGFSNNLIGLKPRDHGEVSKYQYWCNIVNAYTELKLTFPSDKLVALSAVAKTVRELLEDRYVAGIWRRYLERELLWTVVPNEAQARPSAYRVPSWSWAAVDGHITPAIMDPEPVEMLIEVQDLHLDYVTSDTTGLITGGWLRLWGVLKKLELLPDATIGIHGNIYRSLVMVVNGVPVSVRADSAMTEYQPHVSFDDSQQWASIQNHRSELFCVPARNRLGNDGSIYVLLLQL